MLARPIESKIHGVHIGLQTYVFTAHANVPHDRLVDTAIRSMVDAGIGECDLFAPLTEPADIWNDIHSAEDRVHENQVDPPAAAALASARERLAGWRASVSLDHYRQFRKRFNDAGIDIYGLSGFPGANSHEFHRTLEIADVLGAKVITLGVKMSAAKALAPIASHNHDIMVGFQGQPDLSIADPDVIAKPQAFVDVVTLSGNYRISLDIGDAVGGGWDVLPFVREHAAQIALIYLKDRRKDRLSVPWGQGDTAVRKVLQLVRDERYPIRCYIDCDYQTADRPNDVKRSFDFVKAALA